MKRVLILGMYRFPHGDAPSNRILAMAKSIRAAGYLPFVIGNGQIVGNEPGAPANRGVVDGVPYVSVRAQRDSFFSRFIRRIFLTWFLVRAARGVGLSNVQCVITTHTTVTLGLILFSKYIWRKPLIVDCSEWHEISQFKNGFGSPEYLIFKYRFHVLCGMARNVICISKLLTSHFNETAKSTLCLPPQVDVNAFGRHSNVAVCNRIELFYAGTISGKDHLDVALAGLSLLRPDEIARVRLTIAGPSPDQVLALLPKGKQSIEALKKSLCLLGRISRDDVLAELSRVHFTVLLRPVTRYSTAGFPSKIPESLAAGTPVMVNLTSDLGDYLVDGEDSIIVDDCTPEAFASAVRRSLLLSTKDLEEMIISARRRAARSFDVGAWADPVGAFIGRAT